MGLRYAFKDKLLFYWSYFFRKVFCLWFEVKRPRLRMFLYEMMYSARKLLDYSAMYPSPFDVTLVETVFGSFRVRPGTVDLSNVSPAFERRDVDHLLRLIGGLLAEGRKVLFLDIGADLGTFAVTAGNRFKEFASFGLMAFEPAESSFALLKENISLNGLDSAASLNRTALWDADGLELDFSFNPQAPGSSVVGASGGQRVRTSKLDTALESYGGDYDALVMKMDVEGAERRVLDGARKTLSAGREAYLLVEDFVEPEIVAYLEREGWEFLAKKTPYNSFWRLRPSK